MFELLKIFASLYFASMLNHNPEKLKKIKEEIAFFSLKEQAMYADQICVENALNEDFLRKCLADFDPHDQEQYARFNATSIGNAAYLALHAPLAEVRKQALSVIHGYQAWLRHGHHQNN